MLGLKMFLLIRPLIVKLFGDLPVKLLIDNEAAVGVLNRGVLHDGSKVGTVEVAKTLMRAAGVGEAIWVPTGVQVANCLTKAEKLNEPVGRGAVQLPG